MGPKFFDQYTYLHFAVGIIAYFWNISLKKWLKDKQISLPKVALYSEHSYFSRFRKRVVGKSSQTN